MSYFTFKLNYFYVYDYTSIGTFTNECVVITCAIKAHYNSIIFNRNIKKKYLAFSFWIKAIIHYLI